LKKNVASQLISAQLIAVADGSNVTTGTTNVAVELDGTPGTGGTATHIANGKWEYAPIQADTNGDHVTFQFTNTAAVTVLLNVYTTFPQTVDNNTLLATIDGKVDTAQNDLDILTGTDGATLATSQANYAPAKAGDNMGTVSAVTGGINTGAGVITTLDALDTAQDAQHAATQGATFNGTTDSLEALRNRGDSAWATATGFSTHSAADVWSSTTRVLTAATNPSIPSAAQNRAEMDSNSTQLAKLGTPAGASMSADIAAAKNDTAAILADTGTDGVKIPRRDSAKHTQLSQNLDKCATGTVTSGKTTSMISDIAITVDNQLVGRIVIFDDDTTTAALRKQATAITACTAADNTITFTELTTTVQSGDTFTVV